MSISADVRTKAAQGAKFELALGDHVIDQLAELTLAIAQERTRAAGGILTPALARSYRERSDIERASIRCAVRDIVVALVLEGIIQQPG